MVLIGVAILSPWGELERVSDTYKCYGVTVLRCYGVTLHLLVSLPFVALLSWQCHFALHQVSSF